MMTLGAAKLGANPPIQTKADNKSVRSIMMRKGKKVGIGQALNYE